MDTQNTRQEILEAAYHAYNAMREASMQDKGAIAQPQDADCQKDLRTNGSSENGFCENSLDDDLSDEELRKLCEQGMAWDELYSDYVAEVERQLLQQELESMGLI